jgi:hypothetical protein
MNLATLWRTAVKLPSYIVAATQAFYHMHSLWGRFIAAWADHKIDDCEGRELTKEFFRLLEDAGVYDPTPCVEHDARIVPPADWVPVPAGSGIAGDDDRPWLPKPGSR